MVERLDLLGITRGHPSATTCCHLVAKELMYTLHKYTESTMTRACFITVHGSAPSLELGHARRHRLPILCPAPHPTPSRPIRPLPCSW